VEQDAESEAGILVLLATVGMVSNIFLMFVILVKNKLRR
jgi:hypothetical protein